MRIGTSVRVSLAAGLFVAFSSFIAPTAAVSQEYGSHGTPALRAAVERPANVARQPAAAARKPPTRAERKAMAEAEERARIEAERKAAERAQARTLPGVFSALFGRAQPAQSEQDRAYQDARKGKKEFKVRSEFEPQSVAYSGGYKRGTIVIDTRARYLYLVEGPFSARRYAVAVGKEGLLFTGTASVGDMQEWPRWIPTKEMQEREPKKYGQYKDGMDGGPDNPLGARAIYLYQGKRDTYIRIHGTNQPESIGSASSNGCFRMVNDHVIDLYRRVKMGTEVVVL